MKRIIYIIVFFMLSLSSFGVGDSTDVAVNNDIIEKQVVADQSSASNPFQPAIVAYNEGDFHQAIALLEEEVKVNKKEGLESSELYYNLGNAYFRANELGHSRLNYERAALLSPSDRDIQHNIKYLTTRIEDKILEVDTIFLNTWFDAVQNIASSNTWAIAGIVFFLILILCLIAFFFTQQVFIKKASFYAGIVIVVLCLFSNIFAYRQKQKQKQRDTAIIMAASVSVASSPDINSKELFRLHVGTKVRITKDDRNWIEIEIDNGSVGWIQRDKIEII